MRLPKHIIESDLDMNEVDDCQTSEMIDENFQYWNELILSEQNEIAEWWADAFDQHTEGFFDENEPHTYWITDSELIQYITEEGYLIR